jgi:exonuclease 3'-5' domain-containing protein 1
MDMKCLETVARANDETYVAEDGWRTPFNLRYGCKEFWEWEDTKYEWEHRHDPFYYRPVPFRSLLYCVNDVYHLPELHAVYLAHLSEEFIADARERSVRRVKQGPDEPTSSSETETEGGDDAPEGDAMECAEG